MVVVDDGVTKRADSLHHAVLLALAGAGDALLDCRHRKRQAFDATHRTPHHHRRAVAVPERGLSALGAARHLLEHNKLKATFEVQLREMLIEPHEARTIVKVALFFGIDLNHTGLLSPIGQAGCPPHAPTQIQRQHRRAVQR